MTVDYGRAGFDRCRTAGPDSRRYHGSAAASIFADHASLGYVVIALLQVLFYAAALAGCVLALRGKRNRLLYVPYYFVFMNLNVFMGVHYLMAHSTSGAWEKAKRS